jgi:hypothetical protein
MTQHAPGLNRVQAAAFLTRRTGQSFCEGRLRAWEARGLLSPLPARCRGPHHPAVYRLPDLLAAEIIATLRLQGASLQRLRRGLRELSRLMPGIMERPGEWNLAATAAGDVVRIQSDREWLELTRKPGQLAVRIDAGALARELRALVKDEKRTA